MAIPAEMYNLVALGAAFLAAVLVFLGLRGWSIERATSRRLGEYAAGGRSGALDKIGEGVLDRWGVSLKSIRLQYRWARVGGYYKDESLAAIVGKTVVYVLMAIGLVVVTALPLLPALVLLYGATLPLAVLRQRAGEAKAAVRQSLPEVASLLAAEMSAGVSPENALQRVAALPFPVSDVFQEVLEEARRSGRVLFSRPPTKGLLKERLAEWGLEELAAFGAQVDLAASKGTDVAEQMFAVAQGFGREYRGKVLRQAEQLSTKLIGPVTLFFFLPMLVAVMMPLLLALGAAFGGG